MIVCAVDTTAIQPYIFQSNRLQENIGASHLVRLATDEWARAVMVRKDCDGTKLYAGGGNFVCHFTSQDAVRNFTRILSRQVLQRAPGLQLVIGTHQRGEGESLAAAVRGAFDDLALAKQCRPLPTPLLGLSVTRPCASTGLPANVGRTWAEDQAVQWVSSEIAAKLDHVKAANNSLDEVFDKVFDQILKDKGIRYSFPRQLDHLGRAFGEASYLAVVHADGNDMGQRIHAIGEQYDAPDQDEEYSQAILNFSQSVKSAGQAALRDVIELLLKNLEKHTPKGNALLLKDADGYVRSRLELRADNEGWFLPFRPLVFGGDDVTFVCDGRIGLSFAAEFLRAFETRTSAEPGLGGKITACAGVAVVPIHHPFSAAYDLCESLASTAKAYRRANNEGKEEDSYDFIGSCLDWHLAEQGVLASVGVIRTREYMNGTLTQRPVTLDGNSIAPIRSWPAVEKALRGFQCHWSKRHNKVKDLREALPEGPSGVRAFLLQSGVAQPEFALLPDIGAGEDARKDGWVGGRCAYFDAVELEDRHIFLDGEKAKEPADNERDSGGERESGEEL